MGLTSATSEVAWWQVSVEVSSRWAEDAAACMMEDGALGVQLVDDSAEPLPSFGKKAVTPRQNISKRQPGQVVLVASFEGSRRGAALAQDTIDALATLGLHYNVSDVTVTQRTDTDWADRWKQYFKPLKIGRRLWIVPTWETLFQPPSGSIVLHMDPGMAFGTGQHATTALCLKALETYADGKSDAAKAQGNLLDLGCGTGILAMGGCKLGIAQAMAIDNDPVAVTAAAENAALNGLTGRLAASGTPLEKLDQLFDCIVANILAAPLIDMASLVIRRLKIDGVLILSGILTEQADDVFRAYEKAAAAAGRRGFELQQRWTHGDWAALQMSAQSAL